jgi:hypothetical protein
MREDAARDERQYFRGKDAHKLHLDESPSFDPSQGTGDGRTRAP